MTFLQSHPVAPKIFYVEVDVCYSLIFDAHQSISNEDDSCCYGLHVSKLKPQTGRNQEKMSRWLLPLAGILSNYSLRSITMVFFSVPFVLSHLSVRRVSTQPPRTALRVVANHISMRISRSMTGPFLLLRLLRFCQKVGYLYGVALLVSSLWKSWIQIAHYTT